MQRNIHSRTISSCGSLIFVIITLQYFHTDFCNFSGSPITTEPTSEKHETSKEKKDKHDTPKKVLNKRDTKERLFPKDDIRKKAEDSPRRQRQPQDDGKNLNDKDDVSDDENETKFNLGTPSSERRMGREKRSPKRDDTGTLSKEDRSIQSRNEVMVSTSRSSAVATSSSYSGNNISGKKDQKREELQRKDKGKKSERVTEQLQKSVIKRSEGTKLKSWWCLHCHGWKERRARHTSSV